MPVLKAELPVGMLDRFSAEAASAVHAANVVSLLLQSPAAAPEVTPPEVTSRGSDAFYFWFARAIVESGSEWVSGVTLVVERPGGRATVGPQAQRVSLKSAVPDLFHVRVSDVGRADWYARLLRRRDGRGKAGRCGQDSWSTRDGEVVNRSTVVSELTDVVWSVPYVRCPSLALVSLTVPIYSCGQQHDVIIRSAATAHRLIQNFKEFSVKTFVENFTACR